MRRLICYSLKESIGKYGGGDFQVARMAFSPELNDFACGFKQIVPIRIRQYVVIRIQVLAEIIIRAWAELSCDSSVRDSSIKPFTKPSGCGVAHSV